MLSRHFSFILKRDCTVNMWFQQTLQLKSGMSDSQLYPSNLYLSNITKILSVIYFKTCCILTLIIEVIENPRSEIIIFSFWIVHATSGSLSRVQVQGDILDIYTYMSPVTCSGSGRHIGYLYLHESCHVFRFRETYWIFILT